MTKNQYYSLYAKWKRKKEQLKSAYKVIEEFEALDYVMALIRTNGYKGMSNDYMAIFNKDFGISALELCGEEEE